MQNKTVLFVATTLGALAVLLSPISSLADSTPTSKQEAGEASMAQSSESSEAQTGNKTSDAKKSDNNMAQTTLAPHSIMIETALHSTLDQAKGLKSQLKVAPNAVASQSMDQIKNYRKEIKEDLQMAMSNLNRLQSSVKQFPELAQSQEYKSLMTALNEVKNYNQSVSKKMESSTYWKDKDQANSDLDTLISRINTAIDKTQDFNSGKLDVSSAFT